MSDNAKTLPDPRIVPVRLRRYGNISYSWIDYCTEKRGPILDSCGDPAGRVFWSLYKGDPSDQFDDKLLMSVTEFRALSPRSFPGKVWDDDGPAWWKNKRAAEMAAAKANATSAAMEGRNS